MPEQERVVTLSISEGSEQLITALERIDYLERLLNEATSFIANELKRVASRPAEQNA